MSECYYIRVPATTANLGPGFDCLGLALEVYNHVWVWRGDEAAVEVGGHGGGCLPTDASNVMVDAAQRLAESKGHELPPLRWRTWHDIPLARGLGSSAAAIVAGLLAADAVLGLGTTRDELVQVAAALEGHPDNVAPALLGGFTVCLPETEPLKVVRLVPHPDLYVVLAIPQFEINTEDARAVLPSSVSLRDAVFNLSRTAAMVAAVGGGLWEVVGEASQDRLHQPYRLPLMAGVTEIMEAARAAGAWGAALSGSGPTVAAFCGKADRGAVARAMLSAAYAAGVEAVVCVTRPARNGAVVRARG